ncbi:metallophosphoesterase [Candidatus Marsarchaeota archaeon]|nr:metallophosphoesterase [Candidatus Marsarchaeota archaeon]
MNINKDTEAIDGLPILFIRPLSALVCSDLHLGYEGVAAEKGIMLPKINFRKIKEQIKLAQDHAHASSIIINGDIKNEFSKVHTEEFNEFNDLVKYLKKDLGIKNVTLIKGNHDNFIDRLEKPLGVRVERQQVLMDNFLFFHGEEPPDLNEEKVLVMGHLHPCISIYSSLGIKEKLRCFLVGKTRSNKELIILPAMNYFSEGIEINSPSKPKLSGVLSSIADINSMRALCICEEETLDFGTIHDLTLLSNKIL